MYRKWSGKTRAAARSPRRKGFYKSVMKEEREGIGYTLASWMGGEIGERTQGLAPKLRLADFADFQCFSFSFSFF